MSITLKQHLLGSYGYPDADKTQLFQDAQQMAEQLSLMYAAPAQLGRVLANNAFICCEHHVSITVEGEQSSFTLCRSGSSSFGILVSLRLFRGEKVLYTTAPDVIKPREAGITVIKEPYKLSAMVAALASAGMRSTTSSVEHREEPPKLVEPMEPIDVDDTDEYFDRIVAAKRAPQEEGPPSADGPDVSH